MVRKRMQTAVIIEPGRLLIVSSLNSRSIPRETKKVITPRFLIDSTLSSISSLYGSTVMETPAKKAEISGEKEPSEESNWKSLPRAAIKRAYPMVPRNMSSELRERCLKTGLSPNTEIKKVKI